MALDKHRSLILRGNRFLGNALVDKGLISMSDLESANERMMEVIQAKELQRASILGILLFELQVLDEAQLIELTYDEHDVGMIDLSRMQLPLPDQIQLDKELSWTTATLPFDKCDDTYLVATSYYLSTPVVKHWNELLGGKVIWYLANHASIADALERMEEAAKEWEAANIAAEKEAANQKAKKQKVTDAANAKKEAAAKVKQESEAASEAQVEPDSIHR